MYLEQLLKSKPQPSLKVGVSALDSPNSKDRGFVSEDSRDSNGDEKDKKGVNGVIKYGSFIRNKHTPDDSESRSKTEHKQCDIAKDIFTLFIFINHG
ncbi:hypothetical protein AAGG74_13595 [Bacillus mexicanus]|uniref:hypothetical protein n=1 Tax=Bacillus mexicanus TaxID=2834415 RepID=UPI003D203F1D